MLKCLGERPTRGCVERATEQGHNTQYLFKEDQVVPREELAAISHGWWHPLLLFIASQTLRVHMGPQFPSLNTSVWHFRVAFELLIPQISTPYVPITGCTAASQMMAMASQYLQLYTETWTPLHGPTGFVLKTGIGIYGEV